MLIRISSGERALARKNVGGTKRAIAAATARRPVPPAIERSRIPA